jgi:mannose-6-phosphate isomerase
MKTIGMLHNTVQEYSWGSKTAIGELLGLPTPTEAPQAELWLGTHPKAPSRVLSDGRWQSLLEVVQKNPEEVLGAEVAARFSGKLPFLFKVLAAARPLSIQAHPDLEQARKGFARENELGIPVDAPERNYRDDNHKPEIICALTDFWALNGFRKVEEIRALFEKMQVISLAEELEMLAPGSAGQGLKEFFNRLMTMNSGRQAEVIREVMSAGEKLGAGDPMFRWMMRLNQEYPGDIGVLSPILLNLVRLKPGQAMFLEAGELHAYLEGVGMELMANSDNVLRGGLTPKHVDVPELLNILSFRDKQVDFLMPQEIVPGEKIYPTPAEEFALFVVEVSEELPFVSDENRSVEFVICTEGEAEFTDLGVSEITRVAKGQSAVIPAAVKQYRIEGAATLYKAAVPPVARQ